MVTAPDLDAIDAWIEALEEGAFEQAVAELHRDGRHCCLGVAGFLGGLSDDELNDASLLSELRPERYRALGLDVGDVHEPDAEDVLAALNDTGLGFDQIAHVLREELLKPLQKAYREAGCIQ